MASLKLDNLPTSIIETEIDLYNGVASGPERSLLSALLFDGVQAYLSYALNDAQILKEKYKEAYHWVNNDDSEYVFSFISVCENLGINPESLRLGLINYVNSHCQELIIEEQSYKRSRRNF